MAPKTAFTKIWRLKNTGEVPWPPGTKMLFVGRYLGYWRLVGPYGRRKFGQRVWCHVQVVDPAAGVPTLDEVDLAAMSAEIERKKSDLCGEDVDGDDDGAASSTAASGASAEGRVLGGAPGTSRLLDPSSPAEAAAPTTPEVKPAA